MFKLSSKLSRFAGSSSRCSCAQESSPTAALVQPWWIVSSILLLLPASAAAASAVAGDLRSCCSDDSWRTLSNHLSGRQALLQIPRSSWLAHELSFAADLQQQYAHTDEGKLLFST
jgi:hypothetical protein